ncbi:MAG: hypothetical protein WAZ75_02530 [Candidatus Absconditicoccaceae bacterium]
MCWRQAYLNKSEKKSKKLIEDFIALISTSFSEIEYFTDDPSLNERIASEVRKELHKHTSEDFKNLLLNVTTVPRLEFRYVDIDRSKLLPVITATNKFTVMVFPLIKEVTGWILKYGKNNSAENVRGLIKAYSDHFYHSIELFIITELRIAQTKQKNQN